MLRLTPELVITTAAVLFGGFWGILNLYNYYPLLRIWMSRIFTRNYIHPYLTDISLDTYPTIDVFVPAYKEGSVIEQSIRSINEASYPTGALSLYVLVEPDDQDTRSVLTDFKDQYSFTELVVPADYPGNPNKPRALNYAFEQTSGDICGIIDAENIVESDFFIKIATTISARGNDYTQGLVDMVNEDDGWLNALFRSEYGYWYQIIFPSFVWAKFPLPLSGTSCFFRRDVLDDVSAHRHQQNKTPWDLDAISWFENHDLAAKCPWDSTNVTEDFELGLLLWELDYDFELVNSTITEESPLELNDWIRQRTRWQKGKIYTFWHYLRNRPRSLKETTHILWQSFLPHLGPINIAGIIFLVVFSYAVQYRPSGIIDNILTVSLAFLVLSLVAHAHGYWKVSSHPPHTKLARAIIILTTVPLYWVLQWVADLRALKQIYLGQFHWEKTTHTGRNETLTSGGTETNIDYTNQFKQYISEIRLIGLFAITGIILYGHSVFERSIWIDEGYTLLVRGRMPLVNLITVESDPHPPLYYMLAHGWMQWFGEPLISVRVISVIAGALSIFAIYHLGKQLYTHRTGVIAALLLTVSTFHVHYAQMARMYALFTLFTILSLYTFINFLNTRTVESLATYIITTVLMIYTHLFAGFVVLAQTVFIHYSYFAPKKNADLLIPPLRRWWGVKTVIFIAALPWLSSTASAYLPWFGGNQIGRIDWLTKPTSADIVDTVLFYAGHPDMYPILVGNTFTTRLSLVMATAVGVLFVALLIKYIGFRISGHSQDFIDRKTHLMVFVLLAVTLLPYIISHMLVPIYVPRYTIAGGVVMYLLVGHAIDKIDISTMQYLVIGFLLLGMVGNLAVYTSSGSIEQWDDAAAWTEDASDSTDLVIVNPYWTSDIFSYYYDSPSAQVAQYPAADSTPTKGNKDHLRSLIGTNETVMLVSWGYDSKESFKEVLRETHTLEDSKRFGIIVVYHYERTGDSVANRTRANQSLSSRSSPPDTSNLVGSSVDWRN